MFAYKLAPFARSASCSSAKLVRSFNSTRVALKDIVINVPHMSESISEGTLIKFAKQPGEAVAIDDIVAVIETDKVSTQSLLRQLRGFSALSTCLRGGTDCLSHPAGLSYGNLCSICRCPWT